MPISQRRVYTGDNVYNNVWVGPMDHPATVRVTPSALGSTVIDAHGFIPSGFPFAKDGSTVGGATAGAATPKAGGNTGNGTVTGVSADTNARAQTFTLTATSATNFSVTGSESGPAPAATVGTPYNGPGVNFTINAGGTAFVAGDQYTIALVASDAVYGCTIEPVKVALTGSATDIAAASTAVDVTVGTIGQINRDILEDNLGRALTAGEIAGFGLAGSRIVLIE